MKITSIKVQVKNPERVSVYIDENYALSLNHSQLLSERIYAGLEITQERLAELKRTSEFGKAYERALMYAMLRPRSVREIEQYCQRKMWPAEDCRAIVNKLTARGIVDDTAFARSWVENRTLNKSTSQRKLKLELKQKGVADDIIVRAMADSSYDESKALRDLISKKRKLTRFRNDNQKLIGYLARQGFVFDDIMRILADESTI